MIYRAAIKSSHGPFVFRGLKSKNRSQISEIQNINLNKTTV